MKHFVAIVHHEEGSAYGLTFPDVPGCFAASDDLDGIVAAGAEALGLFFDDVDDVPEPRDLASLTDQIRAAIVDEGAVSSVVVPFIGRSRRVERVNISLDSAVLAAIDREAGSRKLTRSAFITVATEGEIERHTGKFFSKRFRKPLGIGASTEKTIKVLKSSKSLSAARGVSRTRRKTPAASA